MKIKISSKLKVDILTVTLILMFVTQFMEQTLGISSVVYFLIDLPIVYMFIKRFNRVIGLIGKKNMMFFIWLLSLMLITNILGAIIGHVSFMNVIYGIYKYYRGFIFFLCCIVYLNDKSVENTKVLLKIVFGLNIIFTFFQFFILDMRQDYLGGVFGINIGVNQYTNLFFVYISIYIITSLLEKSIPLKLGVTYLIIMLLIAALAEIKFFFIEIAILCVVAFLYEKKNVRTLSIIVILVIGVLVGYSILIRFFPEFASLLSVIFEGGIQKFISLQSHYSTDIDIGRAVIFEFSNRHFLKDTIYRWFGLGIGSISTTSLVDNSFYLLNRNTHYDSFYTAYLYIEQGIIGFGLYLIFFLYLLLKAISYIKKKKNVHYAKTLLLCTVGGLMLFWYNMSMASQFVFLPLWFMALMYVYMVKEGNE